MNDHDDDFIDYLAEHESGFMSGRPLQLVSLDEMLWYLVGATPIEYKELPVTNRRRRIAKRVRKAGGVRKAKGKR